MLREEGGSEGEEGRERKLEGVGMRGGGRGKKGRPEREIMSYTCTPHPNPMEHSKLEWRQSTNQQLLRATNQLFSH